MMCSAKYVYTKYVSREMDRVFPDRFLKRYQYVGTKILTSMLQLQLP